MQRYSFLLVNKAKSEPSAPSVTLVVPCLEKPLHIWYTSFEVGNGVQLSKISNLQRVKGIPMIYSYFVKKLALQSFANVQNHNYEAVLKAVVPNVTHHFAGDHALGGTRHDSEALLLWFERLGRVLPRLQFEIKHIWVKGMPWNTTVIVQWVATTTLQNGDPYVNPGVHIITLRWGKVYSLDVSEDSQAVAEGLAKQAKAGIAEAVAAKIES